MGERPDYVALTWLKGEIGEALRQARQSLENYVEAPQDALQMRSCLSCLHQVRGSLQILELRGAVLLAEEMEQLGLALLEGQVAQRDEALALLIQAVLQLPTYLERIQEVRRDIPLAILPLLNDMRAVRGEVSLTEPRLLLPAPEKTPPPLSEASLADLDSDDLPVVLRRLRQMLQTALIAVIRDQDLPGNLTRMGKAFAHLEKRCRNTPLSPLWEVAGGVVEGMLEGQIPNTPAVRSLLHELDKELKLLIEQGARGFNRSAPEALLEKLLLLVAKAASRTPAILALKARYRLDEALSDEVLAAQDRTRLAGPDRSTLRSAVSALCEELVRIKDSLDLFVRSGSSEHQAFSGHLVRLLDPLRRIADTLELLGFAQLCQIVRDRIESIRAMLRQPPPPDAALLMDIAGSLLFVEASLIGRVGFLEQSVGDEHSLPIADIAHIHRQVLKEVREDLAQVKDSMAGFVSSRWDHDRLQTVPELFNRARGALTMIALPRAAALIDGCDRYVRMRILDSGAVPGRQDLDTLAEIISSLDYYLERRCEDSVSQSDSILDMAQQRLQALNCEPTEEQLPVPASAYLPVASKEDSTPVAVPSEVDSIAASACAEEDEATSGDTQAGLLPAPETESLMDDELIRVFIEEAGEVLQTIGNHLPVWREKPGDKQALGELRRAFHTLKGSGRMVQAALIAELGWAVEDLLKRLIDGTVAASEAAVAVVSQATVLLPELLDEFAAQVQHPRSDVDRLIMQAQRLAQGLNGAIDSPDILAATAQGQGLDPQLVEIFCGEAETHLDAIDGFLARCAELLPQPVTDDLQRSLHTLKGSSRMAGIVPIDEIATPLEKLVKEYKNHLIPFDLADTELLKNALAMLRRGLVDLQAGKPLVPVEGTEELKAQIAALYLARQPEMAAGNGESAVVGAPAGKAGENPISQFVFRCMPLLQGLEEALASWRQEPEEGSHIASIQRDLVALRQAARLVELQPINKLSQDLLDLYEAARVREVPVDEAFLILAEQGHEALVCMLDQVVAGLQVTPYNDVANGLQALRHRARQAPEPAATSVEADTLDREMIAIFLEESVELLHDATQALERWRHDRQDHEALAALQRNLHTIKGGARMAEVRPIGDLAHELEFLYEGLFEQRIEASGELLELLQRSHDRLAIQLDELRANTPLDSSQDLLEAIQALRREALAKTAPAGDELPPMVDVVATDAVSDSHIPAPRLPDAFAEKSRDDDGDPQQEAALLRLFLEEGFVILESASSSLRHWIADPEAVHELEHLQQDLHRLKSGARMAGVRPVGDLANELEFVYKDLNSGHFSAGAALLDLLETCHDRLADMFYKLRAKRTLPDSLFLVEELRGFRKRPADPARVASSHRVASDAGDSDDADVLPVFIEEADGLLDALGSALEQWAGGADEALADMLRTLHALKGSAYLADQSGIGDLAHELERCLSAARRQADPRACGLLEAMQIGQRELGEALARLGNGADGSLAAPVPIPAPLAEPAEHLVTAASVRDPDLPASPKVLPFVQAAQEAARAAAAQRAPEEMVRVPAGLLEQLVNLAGETSISRARIEQQISDCNFTLNEMDATIERVRDQLRRLDIETQAQILSRHRAEGERSAREEFDPLELDRYSQLQQLSRSLFESASDLLDLKETLAARNRDAESLLNQQARINTELQEGLMRTRMVPFERVMPRLRRIVRQVATELGKQVELVGGNASGEMDRSVLERIIASLEHMLRNAVDHGIETPEQRRLAGKPETGSIKLELAREGGDILVILADDGAGIDIDAVRRKAVERGLLAANSHLADREVLQFIFAAGFSTAGQVTQISGRGVGLDVACAEVRQLGGAMSIDSYPGKGSRFVIRLPFTVSTNRSLMVCSGEDLYAVPLNAVEGIVRLSATDLKKYYRSDVPHFEYAGRRYELCYLGDLLGTGQQPALEGRNIPLPVLLVRSGESVVAVQVDSLSGSRDIVVKTLGPQFAGVQSVSGATLLGDGRVVVILDLPGAIRVRQTRMHLPRPNIQWASTADGETSRGRPPLIMVVDDSVTVRKVTSRFLERNGMNVLTAKDGADAILLLQQQQPDVVLLDIEMPRMDGYEVVAQMRHDQRLKDLPIIMITSRTGRKHRERAMAIGVNEYFGKPYQESALLEAIHRLVARHA